MCTCHSELYGKRRQAFVDFVRARGGEDAICVFPAAPVFTRNNDVEHDYRQDSDLFYLTGFAEPGTVLVLDVKDGKSTMFVRARDPDREIWDGPRGDVTSGRDSGRARFRSRPARCPRAGTLGAGSCGSRARRS